MTGGALGLVRGVRTGAFLWGTTALAILLGAGIGYAQQGDAGSSQAQTDQGARRFDIPSLPILSAISAFNRQSGLQITLPAGVGSNIRTNPVKGSYRPEIALERMFVGTGVSYQIGDVDQAILSSSVTGSDDAATTLPTIVVRGKTGRNANGGPGYQGTPDWVYGEPRSVSVVSREAIENNPATRSASDALDNVAGVITNRAEGQKPGIAVNIRGLQDMSRITTSIDGARQNFQRSGHGGYQQTFVDTAFIRSIEVEKGAVRGVGGAGSLGGLVDFRSVGVDDILESGKDIGAEIEAGTGTNAYNFVGSAIGAVRLSDTFSLLGGVAIRNIGDYKIGSHGEIASLLPGLTVVDDDVLFSRREILNTLLKAEWEITDDLTFQGSWMHYKATGATGGYGGIVGGLRTNEQDYFNDTFTATWDYDPESELVNARLRLWYNDTVNDEKRDYGTGTTDDYSYGMESFGGSLENTSRLTLPFGDLALHYGVEGYQDNGNTRSLTIPAADIGYDGAWGLRGANPPGKRLMASGFTSATLQHEDWLTLTGGLRYDYYRLRGSTVVHNQRTVVTPRNCVRWQDIDSDGTPDPNGLWVSPDGSTLLDGAVPNPGPGWEFATPACEEWDSPSDGFETVYDAFPVEVDKSGGAWLPSATIAVKPFEWLQPFVSYSRSYRPPAVFEALISGGHPGLPFENTPNPDLKPEKGETWELGVNISQDAVFTADDAFRMKAVYFRRNIEDYISMGYRYFEPAGRYYTSSVNLDGTTKMSGLEIEASYDLGYVYFGGSYTNVDTDWADTYTIDGPDAGFGNTPRPTVLYLPPREKFTLDAGIRLFDERLVLGARVNHVSETETGFGQLSGYTNAAYTTYDLYGSFDVTPQAKLRFGVSNLTDERYVPSLGIQSYPAAGRTFTASLKMNF
ncbi:TonB-dependent hemoglobin/transferrin/lactoferrin family receptor [Rhizobium sp. LC145]|uniref:TonB-dependent hemoglobin/transferrin/lactoferrin family receptor n=1 Tax=Rhizobium sp. LC145 TaxID=1120688 RepID=UPI000629E2E4|nr:TonB-dependent hemoglobin/transferrin/lactoferrin family receptor [Rhizobium sp. LC145]KKX27081.1 ligand-gated channel [Rhizobium sp. LC145]TKT56606.1 TonB-dependent hemoglobin/transferrin/lactoferrin family receptor [Rhizobiaceae bacterium LC148]